MQHNGIGSTATSHIRFSGTVVLAGMLLSAVGIAALSLGLRQHAGLGFASWLVLVGLVLLEVRLTLSAATTHSQTSEPTELPLPRYFGSLVVVWLLSSVCIAVGYRESASPPTLFGTVVVSTTILAVVACVLALLTYYRRTPSVQLPQASAISNWCRATVWVGLASAVFGLVGLASGSGIEKSVLQSLMLLMLLPTLEWLVRMLASDDERVSLVNDVRLIDILFHRINPIVSTLDWLEQRFAADLRSTWALAVARRSMLPLAGVLLLIGWLTTSLVTIGTTEVGIQERFGSPVSRLALGPGIHLKAPWPIDRVHRIETTRVRSMALGFTGPKMGASLLWTKQHATSEHSLLLGDGRDLVTINAFLQFTVVDPWLWHYGTQNPAEMLRVAAEQSLLKNTVSRSLNDVLSEQVSTLVGKIERDIGRLIDEYEIGVEIVGLTLQGLHPPVRVAEDYQAVISAQHEQEIAVLDARRYRTLALLSANAQAVTSISQAQADQRLSLAVALGESEAFRLLENEYTEFPTALSHHLRLQTIEDVLRDRALVVIDDRIEKDGGVLWFDE